ncbi:acetyl-CoA acetyltransferase-like protein [Pseudofrankia saprophytica]|uniref:acetyl-CoA acetyltransferase-like protein n=1 Tax=Pseudofrankia saprophytica TaxID=298655 RepID=UPI000234BCF7|nr:acetyl-CoA acetyltransferase-like protein [Pseudofrankia saprophytica]
MGTDLGSNGTREPVFGEPIAIVGYAISPMTEFAEDTEVRLCLDVVTRALAASGLGRKEIEFTCSGSADYLSGGTFTFVANLDAVGAWPPIRESHVEMDGAWALHEAWVRLLIGEERTALVFGSGKSSTGDLSRVLALQTDPYYLAPLGADPLSLAALQARALLDTGRATERDLATVAARARRAAATSPHALPAFAAAGAAGSDGGSGGDSESLDTQVDALLAADYVRSPLRAHDTPPVTDGACALVLATASVANRLAAEKGITPVWITGLEHFVEPHQPGMRDLTDSVSTRRAAQAAGLADGGPVEVAELSALYSHEEIILRDALGLPDDCEINPSGGPLAANPTMATGLVRVAEAARAIHERGVSRALAHSTSGPCLQQNLVCLLSGQPFGQEATTSQEGGAR